MAESESSELLDVSSYERGNMLNSEIFRTRDIRWISANLDMREGKAFWHQPYLERGPSKFWFHVPSVEEREEVSDIIEQLGLSEKIHEILLLPKAWKKTGLDTDVDVWEEWYYLTRIPNADWTANVFHPSAEWNEILQMAIKNAISVRWFRNNPIVPTTKWKKLSPGGWRLPDEYQELTYIYWDWAAHINTWVIASTIKKINMEIWEIAQWSSYNDSYSYIVFWTTANSWWMSSTYYTNNGSRYRYHSWDWTKRYYDCNAPQTWVRNVIEYLASSFTVNWNAWSYIWADTSWTDASTSPVCFRYCGNNSRSKYRMYYSKITLNDDSELEYIPCYRKSDWICWLYCLQNQTFYSNDNSSWEFTPWEPVFFEKAWEMGEHTVAYYKLDSNTKLNDETSHRYTLTNQNWVTFWNFNWVDCAFFNNNSSSETWVGLYTDAFWLAENMTVSLWFYPISFPHVHLCQFQFWTGTRWSVLWTWINNANWTRNACIWAWGSPETITSWVPAYEWKRHHLVVTKQWTSYKMYIDNVLVATLSANISVPQRFWLWQQQCDESDLYGYMSNVIVEDKAWTLAQIKWYNSQSRWQYYEWYIPTDDTVAYYPLTSKTTTLDLAYNCYHFDVNNNITFWEHQWVDCWYWNSANASSWLWETSWVQIIPNANFTWRCWIYKISNSTDNPRLCSSYGGNPYWILMNNSWNIVCWSTSNTDWYPIPAWERHQYIITWSFSGWSYKLYVDWELVKTWSWSWYNNGVWLSVFGHDSQGSSSGTSDKFNWYLSEWLLERRQWSEGEVKQDFENTKAPYWF